MGKSTTGEKPKFDWITASKTKKYKIITAVVLVIGVLLLGGGILLRGLLTAAVTPNGLTIMNGSLSGLDGTGPVGYKCTISQDESFVLSTSTLQDRALANPIVFTLDADAQTFLAIYDTKNSYEIGSSNYQGLFWLHIRDNAPEWVTDAAGRQVRPSGNLKITCGSKTLMIKITYHKVEQK